MKNTVFVQVLKVCSTVKPSLVFHTGGMFVILINVSMIRMSTKKKKKSLYILKLSSDKLSSVFWFLTSKVTWLVCILLK